MTLKRLLIVLVTLVVLAGGGMLWLGWYAYTPQGRARIIITQLKGDTTSLRGWLLKHHLVRPGFSVPPPSQGAYEETSHRKFVPAGSANEKEIAAADEMANLGREVLPVLFEALQVNDYSVRRMAIRACGRLRDPFAIQPLAKCMDDTPIVVRGEIYYDIRYIGMDSLVEIGPEAIPTIRKLLNDSDSEVREYAAAALAKLGAKLQPASQPG